LQLLAALRTIVSMSDQRRRFEDQRSVFFVTFSVSKRRRLLDLDQPQRIVLGVLNHYFARFGPGERFWQPKSYVFHIAGVRKLREKLDYMHLNPVRAGLVKQADDWRWSWARWYLRRQTVGVPISWVE
jgi:hypothetical protein